MARMNYNRPNGGYEKEPWHKDIKTPALPKLDSKPYREHTYSGHKVILVKKTSGPHKGFYKCVSCDKWLAWAPK